jgi:divalent metal cation (Fe/Co/Zn/Cd) transporter
MREPTQEERAKERSLIYTNIADTAIVVLLVLAALTSGSLTMLSEAVRGVLLISIDYNSIWLFRAVNRGRMTRYEFGTGKIEQIVWVLAGIGLMIGALWVARAVVETLFSAEPSASPFGLAMAAVVNGVNTTINGLGLLSMFAASADRDSGIFGAQVRARMVTFSTTLILQITLTIAALAKDPGIALALDAFGATFIVFIKLRMGLGMIARGLPALLDAPAADDLAALIRRTVEALVPAENIVAVRTRNAGDTAFAEVAVTSAAFPNVEAMRASCAEMREALRREGAKVDLALVISPGDSASREPGDRARAAGAPAEPAKEPSADG